MKIRFIYASFHRHAEDHPELREHVPCDEYFGPPSLGIASIAAFTPDEHEIDFRDDRFEELGLDDDVDLFAISCFTPSSVRAMAIADAVRSRGKPVVIGGIFPSVRPQEALQHATAVIVGEGELSWLRVLDDLKRGRLGAIFVGCRCRGGTSTSTRSATRTDRTTTRCSSRAGVRSSAARARCR